jgi:hypothetical protein
MKEFAWKWSTVDGHDPVRIEGAGEGFSTETIINGESTGI